MEAAALVICPGSSAPAAPLAETLKIGLLKRVSLNSFNSARPCGGLRLPDGRESQAHSSRPRRLLTPYGFRSRHAAQTQAHWPRLCGEAAFHRPPAAMRRAPVSAREAPSQTPTVDFLTEHRTNID